MAAPAPNGSLATTIGPHTRAPTNIQVETVLVGIGPGIFSTKTPGPQHMLERLNNIMMISLTKE